MILGYSKETFDIPWEDSTIKNRAEINQYRQTALLANCYALLHSATTFYTKQIKSEGERNIPFSILNACMNYVSLGT